MNSLPTTKTNEALQQNSSKEGVERKEAIIKSDLRKVDQKQLALKKDEHGKKTNENLKKDVTSLPTKKRKNPTKGRSPVDLQTNEASLKNTSKEGIEEKEAIKKPDLRIVDLNQVTLKDDEHGKKTIERHKEEVNSLLTIKAGETIKKKVNQKIFKLTIWDFETQIYQDLLTRSSNS